MSASVRQNRSVEPDWLDECIRQRQSEPTRQPPVIKGTKVWVDPGVAEALLVMNTWNRKISAAKVKEYADLMRDGLWDERTPQLIVFDTDQRMADGQHRCSAVIKSGKAFWMLIVWDTPAQARLNLDRHRPRAVWDNLVMAGAGIVSDEYSERELIHLANAYMQGMTTAKVSLPTSRAVAVIEEHGQWLLGAMRLFARYPKKSNVTRSIVKAVVARALRHGVDEEHLARFVQILVTGVSERPEDATVVVFRDWMREKRGRNSNANAEIYARCASALVMFDRGEVRKINRPVGEDPWPLSANTRRVDRMAVEYGRPAGGGHRIDPLADQSTEFLLSLDEAAGMYLE